jgi:hypothetical protein
MGWNHWREWSVCWFWKRRQVPRMLPRTGCPVAIKTWIFYLLHIQPFQMWKLACTPNISGWWDDIFDEVRQLDWKIFLQNMFDEIPVRDHSRRDGFTITNVHYIMFKFLWQNLWQIAQHTINFSVVMKQLLYILFLLMYAYSHEYQMMILLHNYYWCC